MATVGARSYGPANSAVRLLAGAAVLVASCWLTGWALDGHFTARELRLVTYVEQGPTAIRTGAAHALSTVGSTAVLLPLVIIVAALLVKRRRLAEAVVVISSSAGAIALSSAVKALVGRPRPATPHLEQVTNASFPSGHATQAAAILPALAFGAVALGLHHVRVAMAAAVAVAVGIGLARICLGVHYLSDVVAGWLLGGAWVAMNVYVLTASRVQTVSTVREAGKLVE